MTHNPSDFVHLHMHTEYSALDGINRVDKLPDHIKNLGQDTCAITDHGNIHGAYKFYKACRARNIKPIIGLEAYYTVGDRTLKEIDDLGDRYNHLVLLAQNKIGLKNLYKLTSHSFISGMYYKPRIDDELLAEFSEGVMATSACLAGRVSRLLAAGRRNDAKRFLERHAEIFKDRFFLELQLHDEPDQIVLNHALMEFNKDLKLPIVVTNDCHYTHQADKHTHELALCMQVKKTILDEDRFTFGEIDVHVAHHDWMWQQAQKCGIPYEAVKNSRHIADMVDDTQYFDDIRNRYPRFKGLPEGISSSEYLKTLTQNKLVSRFGGKLPPEEYHTRLDHELKIIKKMGFSDYMLIDWELVNGAREIGVMVGAGRGSAAGSLVAYALGITSVDPIQYGLVFERFLNIGRAARCLIFDENLREQANKYIQEHQDVNYS